jgi:hypothetical protein
MSVPTPERGRSVRFGHPPITRVSLISRHRSAKGVKARNLTLAAAGTVVPAGLAADNPALLSLAAEDCCWQLAVYELGPRPSVWHRTARAAWDEAWAGLEAQRARIAAMAGDALTRM